MRVKFINSTSAGTMWKAHSGGQMGALQVHTPRPSIAGLHGSALIKMTKRRQMSSICHVHPFIGHAPASCIRVLCQMRHVAGVVAMFCNTMREFERNVSCVEKHTCTAPQPCNIAVTPPHIIMTVWRSLTASLLHNRHGPRNLTTHQHVIAVAITDTVSFTGGRALPHCSSW